MPAFPELRPLHTAFRNAIAAAASPFLARFLAAFLLLMAGACGKSSSQPVILTVLGIGLDAGDQLRRDALDEFTRATAIQVDLIPSWGASAEQLSQMRGLLERHSSTPDIYLLDVVWPGTLGAHLLDLRPYLDAGAREHLAELLENDTVRGRLVSLPFYVNIGVLYYRTDLLRKYAYRHPPETWDELESMAARIQKGERSSGNAGFWGFVWQGAEYEGLTCNALEWQAAAGGGRIIEPGPAVSVNNPRAAAAVKRAAGWVGTISPPSVLTYTEADSLNAFRSGNAAFLRHWSSGYPPALAKDPEVLGRFDITLLPAGAAGRAQSMGGFHLGVSAYSRHPAEAARLVVHLTGRQVQLQRALARGYLPTIPDLYGEARILNLFPFVSRLGRTGPAGWVARPSTVAGRRYSEVSKAYYRSVHSVLERQASAEEALRALEKRLVEITGFSTRPPEN